MKKSQKRKKDKIKLVDISKIRFGIEIEVEFSNPDLGQKLIDRHKVLEGWTIDYDGSLENGSEYRPKDSNHLYYREDCLMEIKEILSLIKCHHGRVSKNTGLHIHIDCNKFSDKQILFIIKEFVACQRYIVKTFEVHPDRLEQTCSLLPRENLSKLSEKQIHNFRRQTQEWSYTGYNGLLEEKYRALNISHLRSGDYGTLEFRIFDGTLSYKKLVSQIKWTLDFIKRSVERE